MLVESKTDRVLGSDLDRAAVHATPPRRRACPGGTCSGSPLLAGIGFTVSLLIGELAFGAGTERDDHVKIGVLVGSLLSALLATVVLRIRNRYYRRIRAPVELDTDADGVPDVYQDGVLGARSRRPTGGANGGAPGSSRANSRPSGRPLEHRGLRLGDREALDAAHGLGVRRRRRASSRNRSPSWLPTRSPSRRPCGRRRSRGRPGRAGWVSSRPAPPRSGCPESRSRLSR